MSGKTQESLESRLDAWRSYATRRGVADAEQLDRTGSELREQASALAAAGLTSDEAFLVALKRVGEGDAVSRRLAVDYAGLLVAPAEEKREAPSRSSFLVMLACAIGAAVAIKIPAFFGLRFDSAPDFHMLNLSLFALPFLLAFFVRVHRPPKRHLLAVSAILAAGAVFANAYPFAAGGSTRLLTAIHLPIALWLVVGVAAAGGGWLSEARRMEFTRFTGEWFITYVLIALGGGVLSALTIGVFEAIGLSAEVFVSEWMIPAGAMAAVIVAAWLIETRRGLVGGIAPMLARVFTPLFATLLVAALVGVVWSRGFVDVEREVLILFDLLLVVVVALLLYGISARDPHAVPGLFDRIQLALVTCALAVDVFALGNMALRLSEFGFSANRTAALGLNVILLVNLAWSAYLQTGFLRSRRSFAEVELWQMRYLPVYAAWAAIVVVAFPPLFGFR